MSKYGTITTKQYEDAMDWTPIVRAAGLLSPEHHPFNIYLLAGAIMRDEIVSLRAAQLLASSADTSGEGSAGSYEIVLQQMTNAERAALKERLIAKFNAAQKRN
jgi:hypothetical protein